MTLDTSKARAAILARMRAHQKRDPALKPAEQGAVDAYLAAHPAGPRQRIEGDLALRFRTMSERMSSTVEEIATSRDAPAAVARYLAGQGIAPRAVAWPTLASLDWAGAGVSVEFRKPGFDESQGSDAVGITGCFCALAETGTLVLVSGPETHASTHLLPETHIALVPASRIVRDMEDAFALLRAERGTVPRALNMVSGPSRTGDIEQTIVLGAHGPYRVHLLVLTGE